MASITIRKLDDAVKSKLRVRAARNGRSMEEEAREILRGVLTQDMSRRANMAESIRRYIDPLGGVELTTARREPVRRPPTLAR
jgi:antitoxin FitA